MNDDTDSFHQAMRRAHNPPLQSTHAASATTLALSAMEWHAPWECGAAPAATPWLKRAPRGDGHAVLVFPGLMTGDLSTLPQRHFLLAQGCRALGWGLGVHFGLHDRASASAGARLEERVVETERPVSLVGFSLGGFYGRELAKRALDHDRSAVTRGTPFNGNPKATNVWRLDELASGRRVADILHAELAQTSPVPTTSVYSCTDPIVLCICGHEAGGHEEPESVEIRPSHVGTVVNPAASFVVCGRLGLPDGQWMPIHRDGLRPWVFSDPNRPD